MVPENDYDILYYSTAALTEVKDSSVFFFPHLVKLFSTCNPSLNQQASLAASQPAETLYAHFLPSFLYTLLDLF